MSKFTPLLASQFLELVASGRSITFACYAVGITDSTVQHWCKTRPAFRTAYEIARREATQPALPAGDRLCRWEKIILSGTPELPPVGVC